MKTNTQIFLDFRKRLVDAIITNPDYQKAKASGNFENFIKSSRSYVVSELEFTQKGTNYTRAIDKGRRSNVSNSGGLRDAIYEWLGLKKYGLDWQTDKERVSLSYAITKNIAKEGSLKFRTPSLKTNIIKESIDKTLPKLIEEITENTSQEVAQKITKDYGNINNG